MSQNQKACDCSTKCCKTVDTSYHYHFQDTCIHPNGFAHKTCQDSIENFELS